MRFSDWLILVERVWCFQLLSGWARNKSIWRQGPDRPPLDELPKLEEPFCELCNDCCKSVELRVANGLVWEELELLLLRDVLLAGKRSCRMFATSWGSAFFNDTAKMCCLLAGLASS